MALSLKTWINSFCNMHRIVLNVLSLAAAQRRSVYGLIYSRGDATTQYIFTQRRGVFLI